MTTINIKNPVSTLKVGGKEKLLNDEDIKNQNHSLYLNNERNKKNIPKNKQLNVYDNSLTQITNSQNVHDRYKKEYIENHKKEYVDEEQYKLFNPVFDLQEKYGQIDENLTKYNDYFIHIDSNFRETNISVETGDYYILDENPLILTNNSNKIFIKHPNHNFKVNDKIMLEGITSNDLNVSYVYSYINNNDNKLIFTRNSKYILVNLKHNIIDNTNDYYCEILNFTSSKGNDYIGNIPLTLINQNHKILLTIEDDLDPINDIYEDIETKENKINVKEYNPNRFYIELPFKYQNTDENFTELTGQKSFTIKFFYYYNIPIYYLNAGYPNTKYKSLNYHTIIEVNDKGYYINIPTKIYLGENKEIEFGGKNIRITEINNFTINYPEPNEYKIKLNQVYKNIVKVSLIQTSFPNTNNNIYKNIKNNIVINENTKLYWQNEADGNYTYSIELEQGNYTIEELEEAVNEKIYNTPRYYYQNQDFSTQPYTNHNNIKLSIDKNKNLSTFTSTIEYDLFNSIYGIFYLDNEKRFIKLNDENNNWITYNNIGLSNKHNPDNNYFQNPLFMLIKLDNNTLKKNNLYTKNINEENINGDIIEIDNIKQFLGIDINNINGEYEIYKVKLSNIYKIIDIHFENLNIINEKENLFNEEDNNDEDYFMIKLNGIDIINDYQNNIISNVFKMYCPNNFRLLFTTEDTFGKLLGFKNVGKSTSITEWNNEINNKMNYKSDIGYINEDDDINNGDSVNIKGNNYIIMVCDEFKTMESLTKIKDIFNIISLNKNNYDENDNYIYNTFTKIDKLYLNPINEISELSFHFYNPDGSLYDFNGLNHNFIIQLTTINELSLNVNVSSITGKQI